ncbi:MAG TPA: hypothetical protein VN947_31775 [Polyangia bacterium]|nr:hypothetical protein [Polyangia bacterium]
MATPEHRANRSADGERGFDLGIAPRLAAIPFFRLATDEEIDRSYDAYRAGDFGRLCDVWCEVAQPTRADLGSLTKYYDRAHLLPSRASGLAFLATVRAVLRAGEKFRARLSARAQEVLAKEFPWLEERHRHIPDGWTPPFKFPDELRMFIDALAVDDTRARWQLCAAINEVQQQHYSRHAAERFGVPELAAHAARERELAVSYFSHWAPNATRELWRQCVLVLDGLNAATFDLLCNRAPGAVVRHAMLGMVTRGAEWRAFVANLEKPQWLMPKSVY